MNELTVALMDCPGIIEALELALAYNAIDEVLHASQFAVQSLPERWSIVDCRSNHCIASGLTFQVASHIAKLLESHAANRRRAGAAGAIVKGEL